MIVVTGASGNVGGELVRALAARGEPVRGVVRDAGRARLPAGAEAVTGDLDMPESLGSALAGARGVFLLGGWSDMPGLVRAIARAGAERVVLLSSRCVIGGRPDNAITSMWLDAEAAVTASGLDWTILRPSGFQSNALRWRAQLERDDVVRAPWPDVPIAAIDPADIAAVATAALTEEGHAGHAHELSGPEPLIPAVQVTELGAALGRPLRYEPQGDDEAREAMLAGGMPAPFAEAQLRFFSAGEYDDAPVVDGVERLTGRPPGRFADWARAHAGAFG